MATARKRWFRVASSIYREPWSRDSKLTMVLLMAYLNDRWARDGLSAEEATTATLSRGAMQQITGRAQLVHSRRALRELAGHVSLAISERDEFTEIRWPKFAEFQHFVSESGASATPNAPPPRHATRAPRHAKSSGASAPVPGWAVDLSSLLITLLEPVPGARIPRGAKQRWAKEIVKLSREARGLETQNSTAPEAIEGGIRWALGPENLSSEYQVVIRSGSALRKKWSTLVAAAQRDQRKTQPNQDLEKWMHSETF